jgi:hypothetical protein
MASSVFDMLLLRHLWGTDELRAVLDSTTYVGLALQIVDAVLARVTTSGWLDQLP